MVDAVQRAKNSTSPEQVGASRGHEHPSGHLAAAICVRQLVKRYGAFEAVRGIDFEVQRGETFGFLGPNGAGKSTTINILCTLALPSAGSASVCGYDVVTERQQVRRQLGLVFQDTTTDDYLSAEQNLRFHAEVYGMPKAAVPQRMQQLLEMVGLWERRTSLVGTFSGGMRRRLEIARGLLHSPRVLFLDEPTIALDPQTRSSVWGYITELKKREATTIFLTTHYMDEAERCDRIAIIDGGRVVALGTPAALKRQVGKDVVRICTADNTAAMATLERLFELRPTLEDDAFRFDVPDAASFLPQVFSRLGVPIHAVNVSRPSLDDVFMSFTGRAIRDSDETPRDRRPGHVNR